MNPQKIFVVTYIRPPYLHNVLYSHRFADDDITARVDFERDFPRYEILNIQPLVGKYEETV